MEKTRIIAIAVLIVGGGLALHVARDPYAAGVQELDLPQYVRYVDDAVDLAKIVRREKDADFSYEHDYAVQRTVLLACGLSIE